MNNRAQAKAGYELTSDTVCAFCGVQLETSMTRGVRWRWLGVPSVPSPVTALRAIRLCLACCGSERDHLDWLYWMR